MSLPRQCSRCLLLETHDTITFDERGVCSICKNAEFKKEIDWMAKEKELAGIIEQHRGKAKYDCVLPASGGKDSAFTVFHLVTRYKIKPLVVCFDHGFMKPIVLSNVRQMQERLGIDVLWFEASKDVIKKTMRESLLRKGDFCWHCHTGIFAFPMHMAIRFKVPLVIWGQGNWEYNAFYRPWEQEDVGEMRFNRYVNLGITAQDMAGMAGIDPRDLWSFTYPDWKDLQELGYTSIALGNYIPWDVKKQTEIIERELGWQRDRNEGIPPGYDYEKIECRMQGARDYLRFLKRGMGRANHLASIDIRDGRITREEGLKMAEEYDGKRPKALDEMLNMVGMTEGEFEEVIGGHKVWPLTRQSF